MSEKTTNQPAQRPNQLADMLEKEDGTRIWRSLGEKEGTQGFQKALDREFLEGASHMETEEEREMSRRSFVKLMGASSALAGVGLAACRRPETLIVPFAESPEWSIPGKALYYASSMPRATGAVPLVVTTHDGRPTKLEPNKRYDKLGGTDSFTQASVLDMYSPSRSRNILAKGKAKTRADFEKALAEIVKPGSKVGFVFGEDESPTRSRLVKELQAKYGAAKFYSYEPLVSSERKQANTTAFGKGADVVADFSDAKVVLSLDSDFLELDQQGPVSGFYKNRFLEGTEYNKNPNKDAMNRLYVVEGSYSLTGGMADHRLRIAPSQVAAVAAEIANKLGATVTVTGSDNLTDEHKAWAAACAADLKANGGKSVVLAGSRQTKALQNIAIAINNALGNYGKTLKPVITERGDYGDMEALINDLNAGNLDAVILTTPANPVYDADGFAEAAKKAKLIHLGLRTNATAHAADWHIPAAHYLESWGDARSALGTYTVVQPMILPLYNGTSELDLLLALLGDGRLFDSEKDGETTSPAYDAVRKTFAGIADDSDKSWMQLLRDGFWKKSTYSAAAPKGGGTVSITVPKAPTKDSLEVVFSTDGTIFDGRYIDNAWLQEAPDPITKVCWDNVAIVSPKTAKELGVYDKIIELMPDGKIYGIIPVKDNAPEAPGGEGRDHTNPVYKLSVNGREIECAVMVGFGHADNVISISLGYGQGYDEHNDWGVDPVNADHVDFVGVNRGFNAYALRSAKTPYIATGGKVEDLDKDYPISMTQEHHAMYGRALAREISTLQDKKYGKDFEEQYANVQKQGMDSHMPENISLYKMKGSDTWHDKKEADRHLWDERQQWAMSIDLNTCVGCNACLVACQAENNIPVVGKEQVALGREMHWIRMDRYFSATPVLNKNGKQEKKDGEYLFDEDNPEMLPQPVACVQCESAPCETVCPVNATVHSEDGLNTMAYNRCIGTRYCANNCPYKARRFNFFDYNKRNPLIEKNLYKGPGGTKAVGEAPHLQRNPNVSVRMRGVMEKCTYCVQRIQKAKADVKSRNKKAVTLSGKPSTEIKLTPEDLRPKTDAVRTACQDACPASAITFGNMLDPKAKISRIKTPDNKLKINRAYDLLNYIGTLPRTSYLARVKNPNPEMPGAQSVGRATIHMH